MRTVEFFAPGLPKGQPRPRAFARNGRANVYDPGTAEGWKSDIAVAAKPHLGEKFEGALKVTLRFAMPRPKSHYRKDGTSRPGIPEFFTKKPDADNLAKAVLDALTQLGAWHDDAQVVVLQISKRYTPANFVTTSGCHIKIEELEDAGQ